LKEAVTDLNKSLELNPQDVIALMLRARVQTELGSLDDAQRDVEKALEIRPDLTQAILLRSMIAAQNKKEKQESKRVVDQFIIVHSVTKVIHMMYTIA
jgi:Flp pilus assembly protein TadD